MFNSRETDFVPPRFEEVLVVLPALDEEACIGGVVERFLLAGFPKVRAVDNGSRDDTAAVARRAGAEVVTECRRGYGAACWTGCTRDVPKEIRWFLFSAADGSDVPEEAPSLLEAASRTRSRLVLGDRSQNSAGASPGQAFGNALATGLIRLGWGVRFRDLGPQRLICRNVFQELNLADRGFGWTLEMQVRAVEREVPWIEIPVRTSPRLAGRQKITGTLRGSLRASTIIARTLVTLWWRRKVCGA